MFDNIVSTKDYLETGNRADVHTTIREDLYIEMLKLLAEKREPLSKALDILIMDLLSNEVRINEFRNKMRNYRLPKDKTKNRKSKTKE